MNRQLAAVLLMVGMATVGCVQVTESPTASPTSPATTVQTQTQTRTQTQTQTKTETQTQTTEAEVGGETHCSKKKLADAATSAARTLGSDNVYSIDNLQCADGWAVTSGLLASTQNPNQGAPTSFVFRAEGQFWVLQDKAKVCGTNPTTTTPPADATIPAKLFLSGCAAG